MLTRMFVQTITSLSIFGALLLLAAGDPSWIQAWILVGEVTTLMLATNLWLAQYNPGLLKQRMTLPTQAHQKRWDSLYLPLSSAGFLLWIALLGLDAKRFGWSDMPQSVEVLGFVLVALGMFVIWQTFRVNSFAVPQVRMQTERNHHVVSTGPYRVVRHPMYSGAILAFLGLPLLLGSWWGVALVPVLAAILGLRTIGEERMLKNELAGYAAYTGKVRSRILPGIW